MRRTPLVALLLVAALAPPAAAHSVKGAGPSNYRTVLTDDGAIDDVDVDVVEAGSRIEVRNDSAVDVVVEGYTEEPYLRITPDGVFSNVNSPATYLNASRDGEGAIPASARADAPPEWVRTSDEPVARWHDHRIHWMGEQPPPAVRADPGQAHPISDWAIPMQAGTREFEVAGTLSWVPSPSALPWVGLAAVVGALALALGVIGTSTRSLAVLLLVVLAVDGAHQAGIGFALAGSTGERILAMVGGASVPVWALLLASALLLVRGVDRLGLGLALLAATSAAMFGGALEWSTLTSSQIPFAWSAGSARALTALTLGLGTGAAIAATIRSRRLAETAPDDESAAEDVADPA